LSDNAPPVVIVVDVSAAAQARNEYHRDDVQVDQKGVWYAKSDTEECGYRHVGSTTNGTCVLVTWEWGGGSGVFSDLLLVTFRESRKNGHLLMHVIARHGLGDRGAEDVTVQQDRIEVAASKTKNGTWPRFVIEASECDDNL
jgi:hypothetical protein